MEAGCCKDLGAVVRKLDLLTKGKETGVGSDHAGCRGRKG